MKIKSPKDFWSGLMFIGSGLFFMIWGMIHYQMGTAVRMGPAYFPTVLRSDEDQEPEGFLVRPHVHWLGPVLHDLGNDSLSDGHRSAHGARVFSDRAPI